MSLYEQQFEKIRQRQIVATVVIDSTERALPLAETFLETGIGCIELTLRSACAIKAIEVISKRLPEILVGAGTVLTPEQAVMVKDAGGSFAVSPGFNRNVLEKASLLELPFAPGISTPTELEQAFELGCKYLKLFPAEPLGGLRYLKCMSAPYLHKGIKFMPLGGVDVNNFVEYLRDDSVFAVGGSWLAPRRKVAEGDWYSIRQLCNAAVSRLSAEQISSM